MQFVLFRETASSSSRQAITMGKYKIKATQAYFSIFSHIPACPDIFRHIQA